MRTSTATSSCAAAFAVAVSLVAGVAQAGPRQFVILAPGMGGTQETAKPYVEKFLRAIEGKLGWSSGSASGEFFDETGAAEAWIKANKPGWGLLSPALYLSLKCDAKTDVVPLVAVHGIVEKSTTGRWHVVVKDPAYKSLDDLEGKTLASNHLQDPKFVSRVVFAGKHDVAKDFKAQPMSSPVRPLRKVLSGEADAALVDDAQVESMKTLPGGAALRVVFSSETLPPAPVVAFTAETKPAEREAMKKALGGLCAGAADVCKQLQITRFEPLDPGTYRNAEQAYCKP